MLVIYITYSEAPFQRQRIKQIWNFKYHLKVKKKGKILRRISHEGPT